MKIFRWLGWLVGVLVIGALGSGLWEVAFRDLYDSSLRFLLTLLTLGLDATRNSIYANIAQGHHEVPSLKLLFGFMIIVGIFPVATLIIVPIARYLFPTQQDEGQSPRCLGNIVAAMSLFLMLTAITEFTIMTYTNRAITHFEHSLTICAPYLTIDEERAIRSQFTLLKTSADYEAVIRRLHAVAAQHKITLPEFTIW